MKHMLRCISRIDQDIDSKKEELERIRTLAEKVTATLSDEPRGGGVSDKVGNSVEKLVTLQDELESKIDELYEKHKEVQDMISSLENQNQRLVLEYKYLSRLTWNEIAKKMFISYQSVHRIHRRALQEIEKK